MTVGHGAGRQRRGDQSRRRSRRRPDWLWIHELNRTRPSSPSSTVGAEEDRAPGGRQGDSHRVGHAIRAVRPEGQLLTEPAGHEERVVDAEAQPEQRGQVEHEDAHRHDRGHDEDPGQGHDDRRATDRQRDARRDRRSEHDQEGQRRERQRDDLAPAEVRLGHRLHVAVEGRAAGELDVEAGRRVEALAEDRQRLGRVVGRQVGNTMSWPCGGRPRLARHGRDDPGHVRRRQDVTDGRRGGHLELGRPRQPVRAAEDDDQGRGRRPQLRAEEGLRPRRFQVVEDEPAGAQLARHLLGERDRDQEQGDPGADDPPRAAHHEAAESIEGRRQGCQLEGDWTGPRHRTRDRHSGRRTIC